MGRLWARTGGALSAPAPARAPAGGPPSLILTANRGLAGGFNANLISEARRKLARAAAAGAEAEFHRRRQEGHRLLPLPQDQAHGELSVQDTIDDAGPAIRCLRETASKRRVERATRHARFYRPCPNAGGAETLPMAGGQHWLQPGSPAAEAASSRRRSTSSSRRRAIPRSAVTGCVRIHHRTTSQALVETAAAEHGARRTAMKSATDNAGDMLDHLTPHVQPRPPGADHAGDRRNRRRRGGARIGPARRRLTESRYRTCA